MQVKLIVYVALIGTAMAAPALLSDQEEWAKFKAGFNKSYDSPDEESQRFEIFQNNLKNIREHNEKFAKGEVTYTQGINKFADLTPQEFKAHYTGYRGRPKTSD